MRLRNLICNPSTTTIIEEAVQLNCPGNHRISMQLAKKLFNPSSTTDQEIKCNTPISCPRCRFPTFVTSFRPDPAFQQAIDYVVQNISEKSHKSELILSIKGDFHIDNEFFDPNERSIRFRLSSSEDNSECKIDLIDLRSFRQNDNCDWHNIIRFSDSRQKYSIAIFGESLRVAKIGDPIYPSKHSETCSIIMDPDELIELIHTIADQNESIKKHLNSDSIKVFLAHLEELADEEDSRILTLPAKL